MKWIGIGRPAAFLGWSLLAGVRACKMGASRGAGAAAPRHREDVADVPPPCRCRRRGMRMDVPSLQVTTTDSAQRRRAPANHRRFGFWHQLWTRRKQVVFIS